MEKIGRRIRAERKARGFSLKELAEKCGVSTMTLQRIETGKTSPSVAVLAQIAHYLSQPIDFFIKEEHPRSASSEAMIIGSRRARTCTSP